MLKVIVNYPQRAGERMIINRMKGLDPVEINQIFEPFYCSSRGTRFPQGMGLAIAREIVEICGGEIKVQSERRQGSNFEIEIPIAVE